MKLRNVAIIAHLATARPPLVDRLLQQSGDPYLGRIITGRVFSGSIRTNAPVKVLDRHDDLVEQGRVSKILAFRGIERSPIDEAVAGDILAIAGLEKFNVADGRPGGDRAAARPTDRPADDVDDVLRQQ